MLCRNGTYRCQLKGNFLVGGVFNPDLSGNALKNRGNKPLPQEVKIVKFTPICCAETEHNLPGSVDILLDFKIIKYYELTDVHDCQLGIGHVDK